ncbi:hypothetical protein QZH41_016625 [Actinostola sp. cb2023]|nr:hypothetical protein QZH41_016625 [Actinostola sp. cb2023]
MVLWHEDSGFGTNIAKSCCSLYSSIGKKGKPQGNEWTLLSAVVLVIQHADSYKTEVVAMGTGSKCIGQSKMSAKGEIINDSHAEIIARRGFLRYLYQELMNAYQEKSSIFDLCHTTNLCQLKDGISFHLFTSHTPCEYTSAMRVSQYPVYYTVFSYSM